MTEPLDPARRAPFIVGIGGTNRPHSATEKAVATALKAAEALGAETKLIRVQDLDLPMYAPENQERSAAAEALVADLRRADGVILASPAYHCGVSGLVKNVIDYVQDMAGDSSPYLSGRAVGLITTGAGWTGAVLVLGALRSIVHALRGWPTPMGVPINSREATFDEQGECSSPRIKDQLGILAKEVVDFALHRDTAAHRQAG